MSYLITGAQGCIGAWVVRNLARRGESVTVLDRETEPKRLRLLMNPAELAKIRFVTADITDYAAVAAALEGADKVIHLAALQVPACQADPLLGARVNVLGTLNLFEAAARQGLRRVVYASSCAVAGAPDEYSGEFTDASACQPHTHYGVYKLCNEGNARVYFETRQLSSIGLRPWAVYGVGRDFGLTSDPTKAIKAAVLGRSYKIGFGGRANMQYANDVAEIFIRCAEAGPAGAHVFNLHGEALAVEAMIAAIEAAVPAARGLITCGQKSLPFVPDFNDAAIRQAMDELPRTPFAQGVRETVEIFQQLQKENRLTASEL